MIRLSEAITLDPIVRILTDHMTGCTDALERVVDTGIVGVLRGRTDHVGHLTAGDTYDLITLTAETLAAYPGDRATADLVEYARRAGVATWPVRIGGSIHVFSLGSAHRHCAGTACISASNPTSLWLPRQSVWSHSVCLNAEKVRLRNSSNRGTVNAVSPCAGL